jgi:hypothetical protein
MENSRNQRAHFFVKDTDINSKPLEGLSSTGQPCRDFFEAITTKIPFIDTNPNKLQILGIPLDKFNA